jgi:hypothetical protein
LNEQRNCQIGSPSLPDLRGGSVCWCRVVARVSHRDRERSRDLRRLFTNLKGVCDLQRARILNTAFSPLLGQAGASCLKRCNGCCVKPVPGPTAEDSLRPRAEASSCTTCSEVTDLAKRCSHRRPRAGSLAAELTLFDRLTSVFFGTDCAAMGKARRQPERREAQDKGSQRSGAIHKSRMGSRGRWKRVRHLGRGVPRGLIGDGKQDGKGCSANRRRSS